MNDRNKDKRKRDKIQYCALKEYLFLTYLYIISTILYIMSISIYYMYNSFFFTSNYCELKYSMRRNTVCVALSYIEMTVFFLSLGLIAGS